VLRTAFAAAANHPTLAARRRPRVAILSSGDELAAPAEARGPAQIVASNAFAVAGIFAGAGGEPPQISAAPLPANHERMDYLRATLAAAADGETLATPIADQDSSRADALLVRAIGAPPAAAGETCRIIRLAPLGA
jgi:molybdopterin biosynthesis enzyme